MLPQECEQARRACTEGLRRELLGAIEHLGELVTSKFDSLQADVTRRMDESVEDRRDLHNQQNELSREVTRALTKLNGATLIQVHGHRRDGDDNAPESTHFRKSDTVTGWVRSNWLILTAIFLAAFAGERVVPFLLDAIGHFFTGTGH